LKTFGVALGQTRKFLQLIAAEFGFGYFALLEKKIQVNKVDLMN